MQIQNYFDYTITKVSGRHTSEYPKKKKNQLLFSFIQLQNNIVKKWQTVR